MRVDDVQLRLARDLHDPVGKRQQILRLAEQRIRRRQHLVEEQAFLEVSEPERRFRADEVRLMPAQGKRLAQLGCHDPASADRGVADDADVQWTSHDGRRCGRRTGCFTTMPSANATPASAPNCASRLSISCVKLVDVRRVATAPGCVGRNWLTKQASARRFVVVVLAHVHDKRRRSGIIDEVVANRLGLPRLTIRIVSPETGAENGLRQQVARSHVIRMAIRPVRHGDDARLRFANEARDRAHLISFPSKRAVWKAKVDAPRRAENVTRGIRFSEPLGHGAVAAHLPRRQIAEPHLMPERHVLGHQTADADLDVVRMGTDGQKIDWRKRPRHRVQPKTSSCLSGSPLAARDSTRAARNAPDSESPPRAKRWRG